MENYQDEDAKKIEFTKIQLNVPKKLLKQFETIASLNHYSRVEAIKEAMRIFIDSNTPEGYSTPEEVRTYWKEMMDVIWETTQDPKYQQLNPQQQQLLVQQHQATNQAAGYTPPTEEEIRKNRKKRSKK